MKKITIKLLEQQFTAEDQTISVDRRDDIPKIHYQIQVSRDHGKDKVEFNLYDPVDETTIGKEQLEPSDFLNALQVNFVNAVSAKTFDYEDFCLEYGYSEDDESRREYDTSIKLFEDLQNKFGLGEGELMKLIEACYMVETGELDFEYATTTGLAEGQKENETTATKRKRHRT